MGEKRVKDNMQVYLAVLTFIALVMLIIIQVSWIIKAAAFEEKAFNEKVAISLKHVKQELGQRAVKCNDMNDYLNGKVCPMHQRNEKIREIDSIVQWHLDYNNIELNYDFSIGDSLLKANEGKLFKSKCYLENLNGLIEKDGIRICIRFPSRNQFLLAQIKGWFIVSILFIVFVATSFFIMLRLFMREKAMLIRTTDFINNMVHEFQTPLANIKFASNLIRKKNKLSGDEKIEEYATVVDNEANKLETSVEQILNLACPTRTQNPYQKVDMHDVIKKVVAQYQYQTEKLSCKVKLNLSALNESVYGEMSQLHLMISNLIDNALKYSQSNPRFNISTKNEKNQLIISISDNGIGIDKKNLPYIFDKYYRVSTGDMHNVKGFGLGLTYVKKIVEMHKGTISVNSQIGEGTEFVITFTVSNGQK